jgi:hypothetical protein
MTFLFHPYIHIGCLPASWWLQSILVIDRFIKSVVPNKLITTTQYGQNPVRILRLYVTSISNWDVRATAPDQTLTCKLRPHQCFEHPPVDCDQLPVGNVLVRHLRKILANVSVHYCAKLLNLLLSLHFYK